MKDHSAIVLAKSQRLVLAFVLLATASGSMVAQTRAELEKKYGKAEASRKNRWIFQFRPEVSLTVIFKRDGKPALMKLASRIDGQVVTEKLADEMIHELWSSEELVKDTNGLSMSMATSQCNQQEYVTYVHFTIKTFKGCSTKGERLETGIDSIEVTWKKMSFGKSMVLVPDPRLK